MTTETWTYIGRRLIRGGPSGAWKVVRAFLDSDDHELLFNTKAASLGGRYEVTVTRANGKVTLHGTPRWVEQSDDPRRGDWAAEDRTAVATDELRKAEARAAKDDGFGDLTLREAAHRYERLPYSQQVAFVAVVTRYLNRGSSA